MSRTSPFSFEEAMATYKEKKPRAYQETCVREAIEGLNRQRDVIIQLPTGTGKTYTYLPIVCNALNGGLRACVLCPTKDNQRQIENCSRDFSCTATPSTVYGIQEYDCAITRERADYLVCLEERKKCEEEGMQCEVLQANRQYGEDRLKKADFRERFGFGFCPGNSGDWAWIQHMLASAKENGRIGIVIDNGCLFRGGKEKVIRSKVIDRDLIECVILSPEKLFYNTGAPGAIIIFNKNKAVERRKKILKRSESAYSYAVTEAQRRPMSLLR